MPSRIIISADDFGISKGITCSILSCCDRGVVNNVSLVPNGYAYDFALEEYKKRPGLGLSVHLNLLEGRPLCAPGQVPLLVDSSGLFNRSFSGLFLSYFTLTKEMQDMLRQQVRLEIRAQINKVAESLGSAENLCINSHRYLHMIPFIFSVVSELRTETGFSRIRVPVEPFFFSWGGLRTFQNYLGSNMIKHVLINALSRRLHADSSVPYCTYTVGLFGAGRMAETAIQSALLRIQNINADASVEIIFHPGRALSDESTIWAEEKICGDFYYSDYRAAEQEILMSPSFKEMVS